jgi:AraC-like DNA-binding protein
LTAYQETKIHGTHSFPFIIYGAKVPELSGGVALHWHEEMEIVYVVSGAITVSVRNTEYTAQKGDIILIHPQTIHEIRQHGEDHAFYFNILFRFSALESGVDDICREKYFEPIYTRKMLMPEFVDKSHPLNADLTPIIEKMLIDPHYQRFHDELMIKSRLFEMIYLIFRYCERADKSTAYEDIVYEKLKLSLRYLEENYAENITVEKIASMSNYSDSHFSKLFKQLTGEPLNQYLKNYRLETAANRIINEKTKISEIAVSCGFSNLSYFSRAFYEKFQMTPSEFRKAEKEKQLRMLQRRSADYE